MHFIVLAPVPTCASLPCIHPSSPALTCLHLPSPALTWPSSACPALPSLAYPPLRLSCIVRSCPALLALIRPSFGSPGLACFAWLTCFAYPALLVLCSFVPFVCLLFLLFLCSLSVPWFWAHLYLVNEDVPVLACPCLDRIISYA